MTLAAFAGSDRLLVTVTLFKTVADVESDIRESWNSQLSFTLKLTTFDDIIVVQLLVVLYLCGFEHLESIDTRIRRDLSGREVGCYSGLITKGIARKGRTEVLKGVMVLPVFENLVVHVQLEDAIGIKFQSMVLISGASCYALNTYLKAFRASILEVQAWSEIHITIITTVL